MVSFTTLIQEYSPLLQYSSNWLPGSSQSDSLISSYSAVGFTSTQTAGQTVTFTFNGTGIQIFGAKRDNHGAYQVTLDGTDQGPFEGSLNPAQFQTALFSTSSLQPGLHTVTLTNQEAKFLDLDYVTWQNTMGNADEDLIVNTVDDGDNDFQYSPASGWSTNPLNAGTFLGGTGHQTSQPGSFLTYTFTVWLSHTCNSVSLYGPIGPDYSPYTVQVDGGTISNYSANSVNLIPQVLLYYADGLGSGTHNLRVMYQPAQVGQLFAIDYASTSSTKSLGGVALSVSSPSPSGLSGGSVAGIVFGILIALGLLFGGLYYFLIRKRRKETFGSGRLESNWAGKEGFSDHYVALPGRAYSTHVPSRHASYVGPVPPPVPIALESAGVSEYSPSSPTSSSTSGTQLTSSNSTSPRGGSLRHFGVKGRQVPVPAAAGQSLDAVPPDELAATRMVVNGRPQDFGSVSDAEQVSSTEQLMLSVSSPPPNYMQATQKY